MSFWSSSINFSELTSKGTPVGDDLILIADSATTPAFQPKQATITSVVAAGGGGGGMTLISNQTASNSAFVTFANVFDDTYEIFFITFDNVLPVSNDVQFYFELGTGATPTWQNSGYFGIINYSYSGAFTSGVPSSTASNYLTAEEASGLSDAAEASGLTASGFIYLYNINSSSACTSFTSSMVCNAYEDGLARFDAFGSQTTASAKTSIRFGMSSGNVSTGNFYLYGLAT